MGLPLFSTWQDPQRLFLGQLEQPGALERVGGRWRVMADEDGARRGGVGAASKQVLRMLEGLSQPLYAVQATQRVVGEVGERERRGGAGWSSSIPLHPRRLLSGHRRAVNEYFYLPGTATPNATPPSGFFSSPSPRRDGLPLDTALRLVPSSAPGLLPVRALVRPRQPQAARSRSCVPFLSSSRVSQSGACASRGFQAELCCPRTNRRPRRATKSDAPLPRLDARGGDGSLSERPSDQPRH